MYSVPRDDVQRTFYLRRRPTRNGVERALTPARFVAVGPRHSSVSTSVLRIVTEKSISSQRSASGQKNVKSIRTPAGSDPVERSATHSPSPVSTARVSYVVRQPSALQCTSAGTSV